jgi:hypothetical protein
MSPRALCILSALALGIAACSSAARPSPSSLPVQTLPELVGPGRCDPPRAASSPKAPAYRPCLQSAEPLDYASLPVMLDAPNTVTSQVSCLAELSGCVLVPSNAPAILSAPDLGSARGSRFQPLFIAEWVAIDENGRSTDFVDVEHATGAFDGFEHAGTAMSRGSVRAEAIVPATIYAFRRCVEHCTAPLDNPSRIEILEMIGPPATWIGTTGAPSFDPVPSLADFSHVAAIVRPGRSASVTLVSARKTVRSFANKVPGVGPGGGSEGISAGDETHDQTFTLELVWPEGEAPQLTFFSERM